MSNEGRVPVLVAGRCCQCSVRHFSLGGLQHCPRCYSELDVIVVPVPLADAKEACNSVLLKPTVGSFLWDYKPGDDLHIGLSNVHGHVLSYERIGLRIDDGANWQRCLKLFECGDVSLSAEDWNKNLEDVSSMFGWTANQYSESGHNCFDFALDFLNESTFGSFDYSKTSFVEHFVQKPLIRLVKLLRVYRRCLSRGTLSYRC